MKEGGAQRRRKSVRGTEVGRRVVMFGIAMARESTMNDVCT
jgi:ribosomal protein S6E (S10)